MGFDVRKTRFITCLEACERLGRAAVAGRNMPSEISFVAHLDRKVAAEREKSDEPIYNEWIICPGLEEINKATKAGLLRVWAFKLLQGSGQDFGTEIEFLPRESERLEVPPVTLFDGWIEKRDGAVDPVIFILIASRKRVPLYLDPLFDLNEVERRCAELAGKGSTGVERATPAPHASRESVRLWHTRFHDDYLAEHGRPPPEEKTLKAAAQTFGREYRDWIREFRRERPEDMRLPGRRRSTPKVQSRGV
jgi:hypothetical protein